MYDSEKNENRHTIPSNLLEFHKWIGEIIEKVDSDHRAVTCIDFDTEEAYGTHRSALKVYYWREETEEEALERVNQLGRNGAVQLAREREIYENLKRKFENQ